MQKFVTRGGVIIPFAHSHALRKATALGALFFFFAFSILPQALMAAPVLENIQGDGSLNQEVQENITNITVAGNLTATTTNADQLANEIWNIHFATAADSLILNVFDATGTQLLGTINIHNGLFALLNSAGVEIAESAAINLFDAGFIASALGSINANLETGKYVFQSEDGKNGFVLNEGKITGTEGSFAALIGRAVENAGEIEMPMGKVALAGGEQVTLSLSGQNDFISVVVDEAVTSPVLKHGVQVQNQVEIGGTIEAHQVKVDAKAVNDVFDNSINVTGHIKANNAIENEDGSIDIVGDGDIRVREQAMLEALNGAIAIESTEGEIELSTDLTAETATLTADKVKLTGESAQTLSGDITITNLEIITPGKTIYFAPDSKLTLLGHTEIQGEGGYAGGYIRLFSEIKGSPWYIEMASPDYHMAFVGIRDSHNLNEELITAYPKADYGGNVGWAHNDTVIDWTTLDLVRNNLSGSYLLGASLSSADLDYAGIGDDFDPIGDDSNPFIGDFDGQGYTISDLVINKPGTSYVGLFGYTSEANIQNVGLLNENVFGGWCVGGLVGLHYSSSIYNSYATGSVTGSGNYVGGLVGFHYNSSIDNSYATVNVNGNNYVGGLIGQSDTSSVAGSYATGDVAGTDNVGGLAGASTVTSSIADSYATGNVMGTSNVGGLVGLGGYSLIDNSYATGEVDGANNVGGLLGNMYGTTIDNSYATGDVTGTGSRVGGLVGYGVTSVIDNSYAIGEVIGGDDSVGGLVGYIISNTSIIDSYAIGNVTGHNAVGGLVGHSEALISNSYAMGIVTGNDQVGGLVGYSFLNSSVDNSYATGDVAGSSKVGGLVGYNFYNSSIDNSYATGSVSGDNNVGGLVGAQYFSSITNSYATGSVNSTNHTLGGLVGYNTNLSSVLNSYATGNVSGNSFAGGLVGYNNNSSVDNSYATGSVSSNYQTGGLVGRHYLSSTITDSYAIGSVNGGSGALVGGDDGSAVNNSYYDTDATVFMNPLHQVYDANLNESFDSGEWDLSGSLGHTWAMQGTGEMLPMLQAFYSTTIKSVEQLQLMFLNLGANYILANNIDASTTASWNAWDDNGTIRYYGFDPIASSSLGSEFTGTFNGQGYIIDGLTINRSAENGVGLFGGMSHGGDELDHITNLGLTNVAITGYDNVGGLAGSSTYSHINNVYVTGSVSGHDYVGGIAGNTYTRIANSYSTANVTGNDNVGGVLGYNYYYDLHNLYATGTISGNNNVGGVIGHKEAGSINNSFATGNVSGTDWVGGLVGRVLAAVTRNYATGNVTGNNFVGGLIGGSYGSSQISHNYSIGEVTGVGMEVGGFLGGPNTDMYLSNYWLQTASHNEGLPTPGPYGSTEITALDDSEINDSASYVGWDFNGAWESTGAMPPTLVWETMKHDSNFIGGTAEMPLQISNVNELQFMGNYLSGHYALAGDIDASGTATWNDDGMGGYYGFDPIGYYNGSPVPFVGTLDGQGYAISGLTINRPSESHVGLFGYATAATISDVNLTGVNIAASDYVGALIGYQNGGSVLRSSSTGNIDSPATYYPNYAGGLVGYLVNAGVIEKSYSTVDINPSHHYAGWYFGGLVGYNDASTIRDSYATGDVWAGDQYAGGLVGYNAGTIERSYATGDVYSNNQHAGGLAGVHTAGGTILDSFSTGNVTAAGGFQGGLVGDNESSTIINSVHDTDVTTFYAGGANSAVTAGWDTTTVWDTFANALPHLQFENFTPGAVIGIGISGFLSWWNMATGGMLGSMSLSIYNGTSVTTLTPVTIDSDGTFSFSGVEVENGYSLLLSVNDMGYYSNFVGVVQDSSADITGLDFEFGKLTLGSSSIAALGTAVTSSDLVNMMQAMGMPDSSILYSIPGSVVAAAADIVANVNISGTFMMYEGMLMANHTLKLNADAGAVVLQSGGYIDSNGHSFESLEIQSSGNYYLKSDLVVTGDLSFTDPNYVGYGNLDALDQNDLTTRYAITEGGDWGWTDGMSNYAPNITNLGAVTLSGGDSMMHKYIYSENTFSNLNIDGYYELKADQVVTSNLTIGSMGELNAGSNWDMGHMGEGYTLTVSGDWNNQNSMGGFIANSGEVIFNDAMQVSHITGNTVFYDFTSTTGGKQILFAPGTTQSIAGTLTLTGVEGNEIIIDSTDGTSRHNLAVASDQTVQYVRVFNSDVTTSMSLMSSGNIIAVNSVITDQNNDDTDDPMMGPQWVFDGGGATITISGTLTGYSTMTSIYLIVDGTEVTYVPHGMDGYFEFLNVSASAGDKILIYTLGDSMMGTNYANWVGVSQGVDLTGITVTVGGVTIGTMGAMGGNFTSADFTDYGMGMNADVLYSRSSMASPTNLTVSNMNMNPNLYIAPGVTYEPQGNVSVEGGFISQEDGNMILPRGAFVAASGMDSVNLTGSGTIDIESAFNNLNIQGTYSLGHALTVTGDLNVDSMFMSSLDAGGNAITEGGDWGYMGTVPTISNLGSVTLTGGDSMTPKYIYGENTFSSLNIDGYYQLGATQVVDSNLTIGSMGTLHAGYNMDSGNNGYTLFVFGDWNNQNSMGGFTANGGVVNLTGAGTITSNGSAFSDFQISSGANYSATDGLSASSLYNNGELTVGAGDTSVSASTYLYNSGTLTFTGSNNSLQSMTIENNGVLVVGGGYNRTINGNVTANNSQAPGTIRGGDITAVFQGNVSDQNLHIQSGTFDGSQVFSGDMGVFAGSVTNAGQIYAGTFSGSVVNDGDIFGGTFDGSVENNRYIYDDNNPVFNGNVTGNGNGYILDYDYLTLIFNGTVTGNKLWNIGGNFDGNQVFVGDGGVFSGEVLNEGGILDGTFSGAIENYGSISGGAYTGSIAFETGAITGGDFGSLTEMTIGPSAQWSLDTTVGGTVYNYSTGPIDDGGITAGTFSGTVNNGLGSTSGSIGGGTFTGTVENGTAGTILGGTFSNTVTNSISGNITGGTFNYSGSGYGIDNYGTITDITALTNSGSGTGIYNRNGATITNISGALTNSDGYGIINEGTITDISGTITNSSTSGFGIDNGANATLTNISGTLTNSGNYGVVNYGTITNISGILDNTSSGTGILLWGGSTLTDVTGTLTNTGAGIGVDNYGTIENGNYAVSVVNEVGGIINNGTFTNSFTQNTANGESITGGNFTGLTSLTINSGAVWNYSGSAAGDVNTVIFNSGTISAGTFTGSVNNSGTISGGTFNLSGDYTQTAGSFSGVTDPMTANNFSLQGGTFTAPLSMTIGGDWSNQVGTDFDANAGHVFFNNASQVSHISGDTNFFDLSINTADKELRFAANSTQTLAGELSANGGALGDEVILGLDANTGVIGTDRWNISVAGVALVDYANVSDSNNTGAPITPTNSINGLNNIGWNFGVSIAGYLYDLLGGSVVDNEQVVLVVNGAQVGSPVTTQGGGLFSFDNVSFSAGDGILVYVTGNAGLRANTVTVGGTGSISNLNLYGGMVTVSGTVGNTDMAAALGGFSDVENILYSVDGMTNALTVTDLGFYIGSGVEFTPGADMAIDGNLINAGDLTLTGDETITANTVTNQAGSMVRYEGTGSQTVKDWSYHHLELAGDAVYTVGGGVAIAGQGVITETAKVARTVSVTGADNKIYDGSQNADVTLELDSNVFDSWYDVSITGATKTALFDDKNVGTGKTVNVIDIVLAGADESKFSYNTTGSTTADITPKALTVGGLSAVSREYDTTTVAALNGTAALSGLVDGDDLGLDGTGVGAFADKNVGTAKAVTVTGYSISGGDAGNYSFSQPTGLTANVTAKALTISGLDAADRTYNGTTVVSLTGTGSLVGVIGEDTVNLSGTASATIANKNVGAGKVVTVTGYTLSGTDSGNYTVSQPAGITVDITAANITLTTSNVSKTYDGTTTASGTRSVASGTLFSGDTLSGGTFAFDNKNVGSGTKTVTVSGITVNDGNSGNNYNVTYQNNTTSTITAKSLTLSGLTVDSKVYDATTSAALSGSASLSGVVAGDTEEGEVLLSGTGTGTFNNKNVGTGKAVTVTGYSISGTEAGNYTLSTSGLTGNITAKTLTVDAAGVNKEYNGNAAATVTFTDDRLGSDTLTYNYSASFDGVNGKNVGTGKAVSVSGITLGGTDAGNYTLAATTDTTTANITPRILTVTGITAVSREYDATMDVDLSGTAAFDRAIGGDDLNLVGTGAGTFANKNVGTGKAVTVTGYSISGADAGNYSFSQPTGLTANVTAKQLTLDASGLSAVNRAYNGSTSVAISGSASLNAGVIDGDTVALAGTATGAMANKHVGDGKAVTVSGYSLSGADNGNYSLVQPSALSVNITAANITLTASNVSKTYDGTTSASGTAAVASGTLYGGDTLSGGTFAFDDKNVGAGNKTVTVSGVTMNDGNGGNNYNIAYQNNTASTITAKALTISGIGADNKVYDGTTVATLNGTGALVGVVAGEEGVVALGGTGVGVFADKNVGTRAVTVSGYELSGSGMGNYTLTQPQGLTADITARAMTIEGSASGIADDTALTLVVTHGVDQQTYTVNVTGGQFSFSGVTVQNDDMLLIFAENGNANFVTGVSEAANDFLLANNAGLSIANGRFTVGSTLSGLTSSLTTSDLGTAWYSDMNGGNDVHYYVTAGALTVDAGMDLHIPSAVTLTAAGDVTVAGSIMNEGVLAAAGNAIAAAGFENAGTLQLLGTEYLDDLVRDTNSGTVEYAASGTYTANYGTVYNHLTISDADGVLDIAGSDLSVAGDFNNSGTLRLNGNENVVLTMDTNSGTIEYVGAGSFASLLLGNQYSSLKISDGSYDLSSDLDVNGTLTVGSGAALDMNLKTTTIGGNFVNEGTFTSASDVIGNQYGKVIFDGTGAQSLNLTSATATTFGDFTHTGTGTLTVTGTLDVDHDLAIESGATLVAPSLIRVGNDWVNDGTFTHNSGTVNFDGGEQFVTTGGSAFYNLTYSGNDTLSFVEDAVSVANVLTISSAGGAMDLSGLNLTFSGGATPNFVNAGTLKLYGNESITSLRSGTTSNMGTWEFLGDSDGIADTISIPNYSYNHVRVNTADNSDTIYSSGTRTFAGNLEIVNGTFWDTGNLTVSGATTIDGANAAFRAWSGTQTFTGDVTLESGSFIGSTGTSVMNGNFYLNGGTFTGGTGTLDLNGDILFEGGTFNAPATIRLAGDWDRSRTVIEDRSQINMGTSTLNLDNQGGTQTVYGDNTFYNLAKTATSAGTTVQFQAGKTQTVSNNLNLQGTFGAGAGNSILLNLRSTQNGTQWKIDPPASYTISLVDVKDSSNVDPDVELSNTPVDMDPTNDLCISGCLGAESSTDSGHNTGWGFTNDAVYWVGGTSDWSTLTNWQYALGGNPTAGWESSKKAFVTGYGVAPVLTTLVNVANLVVNSGASIDLDGKNLTVSQGFTNYGTVHLKGSETVSFGSRSENGTWNYKGDTQSRQIFEFGDVDYYNLTISGGDYTLGNHLRVTNDFTISAGTFRTEGNNLTVNRTMALSGTSKFYGGNTGSHNLYIFNMAGSAEWNSEGAVVNAWDTTLSGSSQLNAGSGAHAIRGLVLSDDSHFEGSTGAVDINGSLTIQGTASMTAPSSTLSVSGNFTKTSSDPNAFLHNDGAVVLDGSTQTITGNNTFNNLSKTGGTLIFTAGSTQTIAENGIVNFAGGSTSSRMQLKSSVTGQNWTLNTSAAGVSVNASYVAVTDGVNIGADISASGSIGQRTTGWVFDGSQYVWLGGGSAGDQRAWTNPLNWLDELIPDENGVVVIQASTYQPVLDAAVDLGSLTLGSGATLSLNGYDFEVASLSNSGTIVMNGLEGNIIVNSRAGTWKLETTAGTMTIRDFGTTDYGNLILAGAANTVFEIADDADETYDLRVSGYLNIASGTLNLDGDSLYAPTLYNTGTLQQRGTETIYMVTPDTDSGTWKILGDDSGATVTLKDFGSGIDYYNLVIDDANATMNTVQLGANLRTAGNLTVARGTLSTGTYSVTVAQDLAIGRALGGAALGTINAMNSTLVDVNGDTQIYSNGRLMLPNNGTNEYRFAGNLDVAAGTMDFTDAKIIFDGTGSYTINTGGSAIGALTIQNGTLTAQDDLRVLDSFSNSGTFSLDGHSIDFSGAAPGTYAEFNNTGGTFKLYGTETLTGMEEILPGQNEFSKMGTWEYVGDGTGGNINIHDWNADAGSADYYNLVIDQATGTPNTFIANGTLDVDMNFEQRSDTFEAPAVMRVGGDFLVSDGATFDHQGGLVLLDSSTEATVLAGDDMLDFFDFSIIANNKTVNFGAGDTFRIMSPNTWTVEGTNLNLTSTLPGTQWNVYAEDAVGGVQFNGFSVAWSNNISNEVMTCPTCFDGIGNTRWGGLQSLTPDAVDPGDEPPSVEILCPGPNCPENIEIEGEEEAVSVGELIDVSATDDCSADADTALKNPACREKSKSKVSVHEGSVWLYCPDAAGNEQICGVMEAGGKVEIEWLVAPQQMQVMTAEERVASHQLFEEMRRKVAEAVVAPAMTLAPSEPHIEMAPVSQRFATLSKFQGEVLIKRAGTEEWVAGYQGMMLGEKDEIKTGRATKAEVHLDHDAETGKFYLYENSLLRLSALERDASSKDKNTVLDLAMGRVITRAEKLEGESKFKIRTPTVVAGVRGTVFEVSVDDEDSLVQFG